MPSTVKKAQEDWLYAQSVGHAFAPQFPNCQDYVDHCVAEMVEGCVSRGSRGYTYAMQWSDSESAARKALDSFVQSKSSFTNIRIVPVPG